MRKLMAVLLAAAAVVTVMPVAYAESDDDVTIEPFGYLRMRGEYMRNLTDVDVANDDEFGFVSYRARIGMNIIMPRDVTLVLDFQALGLFGETFTPYRGFHGRNAYMTAESGYWDYYDTSYGREVVHPIDYLEHSREMRTSLFQGYVDMANIGDTSMSLRFGRQAMVFGDEWIIGDTDFYGGTSFDAVRADWGYGEGNRLSGFWAKLAETAFLQTVIPTNTPVTGLTPDGSFAYDPQSQDVDLYGLWNTWQLNETDVLDGYLLRLDNRLDVRRDDDFFGGEVFNKTEDRWTLGFRYNHPKGDGWDLNANAAYQDGTSNLPGGPGLEISAYAVELQGGYTFVRANDLKNRIYGVLATYSGDDNLDRDGKDNRFNIMFQDRHGRYGRTDFFTGVFLPNLLGDWPGMDIFGLGFDTELNQRWGIEFAGYGANIAKDPFDVNDRVAWALDIAILYQFNKYLHFEADFGHVFARSYFLDNPAFGSDSNPSRIYVNAVAKF